MLYYAQMPDSLYLLSIPLIIALAGILITRYSTKTNLVVAQVLVLILATTSLSLIFLSTDFLTKLLSAITLAVVAVLGVILLQNIRKEVNQKQLAQKLATEMAGTNMHLERLDQIKSEFLSIASHQLRSPITSIRGYVSMILEGSYGEVSPKVSEILEHVSESARQMASSVEDYLNVSRLEANNMKYEIADCNLREIVEQIVAEMLPLSLKRNITVDFRPQFTDTATVKVDIGKARQIIQNLTDNALKYTKENGKVIVTLRKDKERALVEITDNGIGISPEALKSLFNKFERAQNANSINVSGTGLGLYIAKEMTEAMGGKIGATSSGEGQGSTFMVSFPLVMEANMNTPIK